VVSAEDLGFLLGWAVYDTLLYEDGVIWFLEDHVERLRGSCRRASIGWPLPWEPTRALHETAATLGERDAALRLTVTRGVEGRGPSLIVTPRAIEPLHEPGVRIHVAQARKLADAELESLKSTNRLRNVLAREAARRAGAWEAVLLTHEGDVTEGTVSNLFAVCDGRLCTAPEERGLLRGIIRQKILDDLAREGLVVEAGGARRSVELAVERIEADRLARASEIFLTNTTGRVIPVVEVLGLGPSVAGLPGAAGPVTRAVRERVRRVEQLYRQRLEEGKVTERPRAPRGPC
jgi:branched-subunit amino acid aminotransferase/4-amino-4-deoxychorismate lyase